MVSLSVSPFLDVFSFYRNSSSILLFFYYCCGRYTYVILYSRFYFYFQFHFTTTTTTIFVHIGGDDYNMDGIIITTIITDDNINKTRTEIYIQ